MCYYLLFKFWVLTIDFKITFNTTGKWFVPTSWAGTVYFRSHIIMLYLTMVTSLSSCQIILSNLITRLKICFHPNRLGTNHTHLPCPEITNKSYWFDFNSSSFNLPLAQLISPSFPDIMSSEDYNSLEVGKSSSCYLTVGNQPPLSTTTPLSHCIYI